MLFVHNRSVAVQEYDVYITHTPNCDAADIKNITLVYNTAYFAMTETYTSPKLVLQTTRPLTVEPDTN
jgi:hypothetical protein